jgi:hypothetical protein
MIGTFEGHFKNHRDPWSMTQVLICTGLFLVSSDRFLALPLGSFTLKPSYIFFWLAFPIVVADYSIHRIRRLPAPFPGLPLVIGGLVVVNVLAAVVGISPKLASQQLITIFGGAIVPFLCIGFGVRRRIHFDRACSALVAGAVTAATYGFYQLIAAHTGLPQGIVYTAVVGGVGRISAWSYEPAFFVFFLELSLAVVVGDVLAKRKRFKIRPEILLTYLIACLVLANSRAGFISLPVLVLLILRANTAPRRRLNRQSLRFLRIVVVSLLVVVLVGLPLGLNAPKYVLDRVQSIANTNEAQSNAVRVNIYRFETQLVKQRPWLGYGPSSFGLMVGNNIQIYSGADPHKIAADNLILQSLLDAGFVSLPILLLFLWLIWRYSRRAKDRQTRIMLSGVITVLLINSMLASFFWDMKLWVILGLAYACERISSRELRSDKTVATSGPSQRSSNGRSVSAPRSQLAIADTTPS